MTFSSHVDSSLQELCDQHGLTLYTEYKGENVRSISLVDDAGCAYQIWLEESDSRDFDVCCWDFEEKRHREASSEEELAVALVNAYQQVLSWIESRGNTRSSE